LAIIVGSKSIQEGIYTSKYNRWFSKDRSRLFNGLSYARIDDLHSRPPFPKIGSKVGKEILEKIELQRTIKEQLPQNGHHPIFYTRKLSGFVQILDFVPLLYDVQGRKREPSELKSLAFDTEEQKDIFLATLNSSLFYWFLTVFSDCRNLNRREILNFPLDAFKMSSESKERLKHLAALLMSDIQDNSEMREMNFKRTGKLTVQCTFPKHSKQIIDQIDLVLAEHYLFTEEQRHFIINYDLIFRMGEEE
jgi:hypothetical protein